MTYYIIYNLLAILATNLGFNPIISIVIYTKNEDGRVGGE